MDGEYDANECSAGLVSSFLALNSLEQLFNARNEDTGLVAPHRH